MGDIHYNAPYVEEACEKRDLILVIPPYGSYPHADDGVGVRRILHRLRSLAIENLNELLKAIIDIHGRVPTKGLTSTRRFALGAVFVYQLTLPYRFENGLDWGSVSKPPSEPPDELWPGLSCIDTPSKPPGLATPPHNSDPRDRAVRPAPSADLMSALHLLLADVPGTYAYITDTRIDGPPLSRAVCPTEASSPSVQENESPDNPRRDMSAAPGSDPGSTRGGIKCRRIRAVPTQERSPPLCTDFNRSAADLRWGSSLTGVVQWD